MLYRPRVLDFEIDFLVRLPSLHKAIGPFVVVSVECNIDRTHGNISVKRSGIQAQPKGEGNGLIQVTERLSSVMGISFFGAAHRTFSHPVFWFPSGRSSKA
jgi:hypothetical protein